MTEPIYFGCLKTVGHWFHTLNGYRELDLPTGWPWGYEVDGGLQPKPEAQGHAKLHHKDGWTVLAWWDRTVDTRPASCSALTVHSKQSFEEMVELLRKYYPNVAERQIVPLYDQEPTP